MPFRKKAKNLFKSRTRDDSLSATSTNESTHEVYKPGEPMPPPKYRRPAKKEHTDKLEAFSFADAWRKRSFQSVHSPGGTRASSRRTSMLSVNRKSVGRKSFTRPSEDGGESNVMSGDAEAGASRPNDSAVGGVGVSKLRPEPEQEGDDDVANVGLSPVNSKEKKAMSRPRTAEEKQPNGLPNGLHKTMSTARDHQPFTEQDIANAMQRSHAQVPAQS